MMGREVERPETWHWRDDAACAGDPADRWYLEVLWPLAKQTCAGCPVREACLEDALARREPHGVWGGMDPVERDRELRRRRWAARPAEERAAASRAKREAAAARQPIRHGTEVGYQAHRRRGEEACQVCREASAAARARRKEAAS